MTTIYTNTEYYGLSLYGDNDPADLRDGYNKSMRAIDSALKRNSDQIAEVRSTDRLHDSIHSALGVANAEAAGGAKTRWDDAATNAKYAKNTANSNREILAALGATNTSLAQSIKNDITKATNDAKRALNLASEPTYLKKYVVVLGDSWIDGYHDGAKHLEQSPAVAIKEKLSPNRFYYKGTSGGGFNRHGDDGTFADIWSDVPDKDKVSAVIIVGGQNDARADENAGEEVILDKARQLMETIHSQAPAARIHLCPMVLSVGQTLTNKTIDHQNGAHRRLRIYTALTTGIKSMGYDYVRVHEGGYRIGAEVAKAPDGGDGKDGAHLSKDGYRWAGLWIAHCIANNIDLWPTAYANPIATYKDGGWSYCNVFEHDGILTFGLNFKYTIRPTEGAALVTFPQWCAVGNPHYYPSYSGAGHYMAIEGSTITIRGIGTTVMPEQGTIAQDFVIPAGI